MIIDEVNRLGDTDFHHICIEFLSDKHKLRFINSGINKKGRPVGHELDGISPDFKVSGEFSVDQDYFSTSLVKLKKDLTHSLKRNPRPNLIYLISSQSATNIQKKKIRTFLKKEARSKKTKVILYDANEFVDELLHLCSKSHSLYQACAPYMTMFRQVMVLFGAENLFPNAVYEYKARINAEKELQALVRRNQRLLIHGISGIGKSQLIVRIKNIVKNNYDYVIWVDGSELTNTASLSSYDFKRYGHPYDLRSLLADADVLLCIDSLEGKEFIIEDLHQIKMSKGSRILVTSQKKTKAIDVQTYALKGLMYKEFSSVLKDGVNISDHSIKELFLKSDGHPLLASTINKMLKNHDIKESDIDDVVKNLGNVETINNETLVQGLIKKHIHILGEGLSFIKTLKSSRFHQKMIQSVLGTTQIVALKNRGFLIEEDDIFFKVHDLLYNSIISYAEIREEQKWTDKFVQLFERRDELSKLEFFQMSNAHLDILKRIAWDSDLVVASYLLMSYIEVDNDFNGLEFQGKFNERILRIVPDTCSFHESMLCIEYYELMFRYYQYYKRDLDLSASTAKEGLRFCQEVLEKHTDLTFKKNILHHAGKFSRQLKNTGDAIEYFLAALGEDKDFCAAKLQLFRSYHWVDTDPASTEALKTKYAGKADPKLITDILDLGISSFENVSPSVLLHSFQELRKSPFYGTINELIPKYEDLFFRTLQAAQFTNRVDYLDVVGGIGDKFILHNSTKFLSNFSTIRIPGPQAVYSKSTFSIGQIYKSIAKERKDKTVLDLAGLYYEKVLAQKYVRDYELTHIMDYYNLSGNYHKALSLFARIQKKDESFTCLRNSCSLYGIGKKEEALAQLDLGITNLPAHYHEAHMLTFTSLRERYVKGKELESSRSW